VSIKGKSLSVVGLDIGSYSIKHVEVEIEDSKTRLIRVSVLPISDASTGTAAKALALLVDKNPLVNKRVRIAVSGGGSLLIRRIQLPNMTRSELAGAIRFEAESHIPFPIDECEVDFQILGQTEDKKSIHVMLVAAKKELINERLKLAAAVNCVPEIIDVDIFCLINAYEVLGQAGAENMFGLLNIGHLTSSFAIVRNHQPFFVREIPHGALGITQALMQAKGITQSEAQRMKSEPAAEGRAELQAALEKGLEPLIEEMRHSIDYVDNDTGEELKTVWLSGGGALCPGSAQTLSDGLGIQASLWDNTKRLEVFGGVDQKYLSAHSLELNVALGMVLRGQGAGK
jgi:type IV pilus assembly protein PilM